MQQQKVDTNLKHQKQQTQIYIYIGPKPIKMEILKIQEINPSICIEPGAISKCQNEQLANVKMSNQQM